jgi:hypothetical protein
MEIKPKVYTSVDTHHFVGKLNDKINLMQNFIEKVDDSLLSFDILKDNIFKCF